MCVLNCELDQRCIWFQLCKVTESLFYCETCCRWKKIRGFDIMDDPGCKYIEKVSSYIYFLVEESVHCFDYLLNTSQIKGIYIKLKMIKEPHDFVTLSIAERLITYLLFQNIAFGENRK